jgi:hypothetical protein
MKKIILLLLVIAANVNCFAQKDYSEYFKAKSEIAGNVELKDYQNALASRCQKAFTKNKPIPYDLIIVSNYFYNNNNKRKGEKYLMKAASAGLKPSETYFRQYFDSLFIKDKKLEAKTIKRYKNYLRNCDIENSFKIIKLVDNDQITRSFLRGYEKDTAFSDYKWKQVRINDSANYFSLVNILNTPEFNSTKLTIEAQFGMSVILMHSTTNHYANPDSIFALLKKEMLKGVITPDFYANCVDRYYGVKGLNYYCKFYHNDLPIYDVENVDKRRLEVFLPPLYLSFKWNNKLDQLPESYIYVGAE